MRVTELLRRIEQNGWKAVRQSGGHRLYRHPSKPGLLVIPMHGGKEIATGTLNNILKQAGLK